MAEVKISELTSATTPLAGTETVPIVQGGVTKKVAVSNLGGGGSLPAWIETNATDLTLWNNGKGNIATNTSFGDGALKSNTSGSNNTVIGVNASDASTTAQRNVAIGSDSLASCTTGTSNTIIGYAAGFGITTGNGNVLIGQQSLTEMSTTSDALAIGVSSGAGSNAIAIGHYAYAEQGGIAIGYETYAATGAIAFGGFSYPAGIVASQINTSSKYWEVIINGTVQKILLA